MLKAVSTNEGTHDVYAPIRGWTPRDCSRFSRNVLPRTVRVRFGGAGTNQTEQPK